MTPRVISFIVKVWIDDDSAPSASTWHGLVTTVPQGRQHYVRRVSEIAAFLKLSLSEAGVHTWDEDSQQE